MTTSASMKKILVTGGAGFIGSHLVEAAAARFPSARIVVLDKLTYAGDEGHLSPLIEAGRVELLREDVCDHEAVQRAARGADLIIHAAAETHVDRSFRDPLLFLRTNVLGTHAVMEAARRERVPRVVHISTDEVYGEVLNGFADEHTLLNPTNPYSASKAAAEMVVCAYRHSFGVPALVVRANNVYGTRQFPEKLIPNSVVALLDGDTIPLHGDGRHTRHWLPVQDMAAAILLIAERGEVGETYNVGSRDEYENREVVRLICEQFGADYDDTVRHVSDRPFNDHRYGISLDKVLSLGWSQTRTLAHDIPGIVEWYRENIEVMRDRVLRDRLGHNSIAMPLSLGGVL